MQVQVRALSEILEDPYVQYLEPKVFRSEISRLQGTLSAMVDFTVVKDDVLRVLEVGMEAPPGLRAGDEILSLDGASTEGMSVEEARSCLSGSSGSTLRVEFRHKNSDLTEIVHAAREGSRGTVEQAMLEGQIGYVKIRRFTSATPGELDRALESISGARGLVLDLRNNGGGLVDSAVEVCSRFLESGTKVVTVERRQSDELYRTRDVRRVQLPLGVLINGESASAAEIVAAALRDEGAGKLLGSTTFGKGSVQRYCGLGDGSGLKFTSARYRTSKGLLLQGSGIQPDVEVEEAGAVERARELLVRSVTQRK